jgi:hypothetical protein
MKDGMYFLEFRSSLGVEGVGLAVLVGQSLNGGDDGYVYQGSLQGDAATISSKVHISRYNPSAVSIFGPLENFDLELSGTWHPNGQHFSLTGTIPGQPHLPISVNGCRFRNLGRLHELA